MITTICLADPPYTRDGIGENNGETNPSIVGARGLRWATGREGT